MSTIQQKQEYYIILAGERALLSPESQSGAFDQFYFSHSFFKFKEELLQRRRNLTKRNEVLLRSILPKITYDCKV